MPDFVKNVILSWNWNVLCSMDLLKTFIITSNNMIYVYARCLVIIGQIFDFNYFRSRVIWFFKSKIMLWFFISKNRPLFLTSNITSYELNLKPKSNSSYNLRWWANPMITIHAFQWIMVGHRLWLLERHEDVIFWISYYTRAKESSQGIHLTKSEYRNLLQKLITVPVQGWLRLKGTTYHAYAINWNLRA